MDDSFRRLGADSFNIDDASERVDFVRSIVSRRVAETQVASFVLDAANGGLMPELRSVFRICASLFLYTSSLS